MSAWTRIAHTEIPSGGQAEIEFASISSSYTDLLILISARSTQNAGNDNLFVRFNTSSTNFTAKILEGTGAAVNGDTSARYLGAIPGATSTTSTFGSILVYIPNYTSSNAKSFSVDSVQENNQITAYTHIIAGLWNPSTQAAITNIVLDPSGGNFAQYTSATLYGILKGSSGGVVVS
jgi:hypothetical protein